ncbi:MAG: M48 family metallopeptidase [Desulfobulbaceae bacterium]|nr:M48 family metallopeptidase [Desulfobulbaceae bacterium]
MHARLFIGLILVCSLFMPILSCTTVPITGRSQLSLVSDDALLDASRQQYSEFMGSQKIITTGSQSSTVEKVGRRIAAAADRYLRDNGRSGEADAFEWEFNLVANDEINAWAMPGGKVAVYSGILPVTRDETGLAVVMGHEIAHVVAKHGSERMSQQLIAQMGGQALSAVLASSPEATQSLWMRVYGAGATLGVMLPYSRLQESESDRLGMIFMAMAGYDPRAAVDLWQSMAELKGGRGAPEILSTHPTDQTRIRDIREFMPTALQYYEGGRR